MKNVKRFLEEHKLRAEDINTQNIVDSFTSEMLRGLQGNDSSLKMIPTYIEADNHFSVDLPVLAIDAGGTNFRAALVKVSRGGNLEITNVVNDKMPGLEGEISKDEFFKTIADYVRHLAEKTDRIGFCFSYPSEILPNRDGKLIHFCKEVQAPGVVGQLIGKNLLDALGMPEKQIVILNDTVATLLAGKSASIGHDYDSFLGYILGTGTNTCYIENNNNILKNKSLDSSKSQIINIESGNFSKAPRTDLDHQFDNATTNPGSHTFEKMISGGYFGPLCLLTLKTAAKEGVFAGATASHLLASPELSSEEVNAFIVEPNSDNNLLSSFLKDKDDVESCLTIVNCLLDRAALLVAGNLAAVVLKTDKGKTKECPILVTVEGSIYYKLHNMRTQIDKYFRAYLSGHRKRFVEFMEVKQSSLVGAALAALIN
ncbi:MAG: hexokinase [Bacteroidales bacterium]|jgi:hexokinase